MKPWNFLISPLAFGLLAGSLLHSAQIGTNDFRISTMGVDGDTDIDASDPDMAYNATDNEYVVVWESDDTTGGIVSGETEIFAQRINASTGALVGSRVRVSTTRTDGDDTYDARDAAVAWDSINNQYYIVWSSDQVADNDYEIYGQLFSNTLSDLTGETRLSTTGTDGDTFFGAGTPDIVFNSTAGEYYVVWQGTPDGLQQYEVVGRRVSSAGAAIGSAVTLTDAGPSGSNLYGAYSPTVAWNSTDNEYLVVAYGDFGVENEFEVWGQLVNASGAAIGSNDFRITNIGTDGATDAQVTGVSLTYNNALNQYLVVFSADQVASPVVDNEVEIWGQMLNANGSRSGGVFRISTMGDDSETNPVIREDYDASEPDVAFNAAANEYFVTWYSDTQFSFLGNGELEIFGQRLNASTLAAVGPNVRLSDAGTERSIAFPADSARVVAGPAGEWLICWEMEDDTDSLADGENEIYGQRYSTATLNNAPQEVLISATEFEDDVGVGDLVVELGVIDGDTTDSFTYSLVAGIGDADNGSFTVSGESLLGATSFDANSKSSYSIRLRVSDGTSTVEGTFTLTVLEANDTRVGERIRLSTYAPDGDDSYDSNLPWAAYHPGNDEFIVVWYGESSDATYGLGTGEQEVFAIRVDALTYSTIGSPVRISDSQGLGNTNGSFLQLDIAYDSTNDQFLVVWITDDTGTDNEYEAFGQFLSPTLAELGSNDFRITNAGPNGNTAHSVSEARVIYNSTSDEFLVVIEADVTDSENEIYAQRISGASRSLVGGLAQISSVGANDADDPHVAWNSTNNTYLFVWDADPVSSVTEIYGQFASSTLGLIGSTFQISQTQPANNTNSDADVPFVAYNSTANEFFVVWDADSVTGGQIDNENEIFGRRVSGTSATLLGSETRYSDLGGIGESNCDANDARVLYSAAKDEYLILWSGSDTEGGQVPGEDEMFVQRVDASTGNEIDGDERVSFLGPDGDTNYDAQDGTFAYDPEHFQFLIVFYGDDNNGGLLDNEYEAWAQFWRYPPPKVSSIVRASANPPAGATVSWTVTFSEAVSGIDTADFSLSKTGTANGAITSVSSSSGTTVTVTAGSLAGTGDLALRLVDNDTISANSTSFTLGGTGTGNGNALGEAYNLSVANSAPTISGAPASLSVTQETLSDLTLGAVTFADTDGDSLTVTLTANSGVFTASTGAGVTVVSGSGSGTLVLTGSVASLNGFFDTASNIQYTGASSVSGSGAASFTIVANDGTASSAASTVSLNITTVATMPATLTFTSDGGTAWDDGIAEDGEGGSSDVSGYNFEVANISDVNGTVTTPLSWENNTFLATSDSGFSALTRNVDSDPGWKGFVLRTSDGAEFQFNGLTYYNWGMSTAFDLEIRGYRDGAQVASATLPAFDADYDPLPLTVGPAFDNVDEVRFYTDSISWHSFNSFLLDVPVANAAPTASVTSAPDVSATGGSTYTFRVQYEDSDGTISSASLGSDDVAVSGLAYASHSVVSGTDGATTVVDYTFTPPGGNWDFADNGNYTVVLGTGPVTDNLSSPVATIGGDATFVVNLPSDVTAPTVSSIVRQAPTAELTNADTLVWDVTFNEPVQNVDTSDFSVSGTTGSVSNVTNPSGNTWRVTVSGGDLASLNGTVTLSFAGGQNIADAVGNALVNTTPTGTNEPGFILDNTAPTVELSIDETILTIGETATVTFTFSEAPVSFGASNVDLSNAHGTLTGFTGSGTIYSATFTPEADRSQTSAVIEVLANWTDAAGNSGVAHSSSVDFTLRFDTESPVLLSVVRLNPTAAVTNADSVAFRVTFSESMGRVLLQANGAGSPSAITSPGAGVYDVTVGGSALIDFNGTVSIGVSSACLDFFGNPLLSTTPTGASESYQLDNGSPTIASTSPTAGNNLPNAGDNLSITFSENIAFGSSGTIILRDPVNGTVIETFDVSTQTGDQGGTIAISGTTLTINPGGDLSSGNFSVRMGSGAIVDSAGNTFGGISDDSTFGFGFTDGIEDSSGKKLVSATPTGLSQGYILVFNQPPSAPTLLTPVDSDSDLAATGRTLNVRPPLVWEIPADTDGNSLHFEVLLDAVDGSTVIADSSADVSGFSYFNGSAWIAYPSGGVPEDGTGATLVRYVPESDLAAGGTRHFWTIRASDGTATGGAATVQDFYVGGRTFTDSTLETNVSRIRVPHITELREEINYARVFRGLVPILWTDDPIVANETLIRKVHFDEMRAAIESLANETGLPTPSWSASLTAYQSLIQSTHVEELRDALSQQ